MSDTKTRTDCGYIGLCPVCGPFVPEYDREQAFTVVKQHVERTGHKVAVIPCNIVEPGEPE